MNTNKWPKKMTKWTKRYGYAEIIGILCAYLGYLIAIYAFPGNSLSDVYISSISETIGYYCVILTREFLFTYQIAKKVGKRYSPKSFIRMTLKLLAEFGPAELLDILFIRPFCFIIAIQLFGVVQGILIGKGISDLIFYIPVIFCYKAVEKLERD